MEELIRSQMHDALDVEAPPPHLRAHVMDSLPVGPQARRPASTPMQMTGQWAAGVVATLLAAAIIVGLLYSRGLIGPVPVRSQPAPPAGLISPEGVAVASDGSVYVSDFLGDRVFKLKPDGRVGVFAGGGVDGDGPATKAWLNHPAGVALDGAGNLYIADATGGTIRRVDGRGIISTLVDAGNVMHAYGLMSVAVDSSGDVWVSEFYGSVHRVDATGSGSTLDLSLLPAPNWLPGYMAFDSASNLYVSDARESADTPVTAALRFRRSSTTPVVSPLIRPATCTSATATTTAFGASTGTASSPRWPGPASRVTAATMVRQMLPSSSTPTVWASRRRGCSTSPTRRARAGAHRLRAECASSTCPQAKSQRLWTARRPSSPSYFLAGCPRIASWITWPSCHSGSLSRCSSIFL